MGEEVDNIKAVYLEIVDKNLTSKDITVKDIIRAPFAGIYMREVEDEKALDNFVVLSGKEEKALDIFNIMYYNIVTVEIAKDGYSDLWFARNDERDQEAAFKIISDVLAYMQKFNRVTQDESIINVASYKPNQALLSKVAGDHVTHTTYGAKKQDNANTTGNGVYSVYKPTGNVTTYKKKEDPKPTAIKRARGANKALLKQMFDAVQKISKGEYELKLPEIPEEENKDEDKTEDKTAENKPNANYYDGDWYNDRNVLGL